MRRFSKYIYQRIREKFPDLFIETEQSKATSTVFAEFLPGAALADPNGNPWGQYGNREIPPALKTVIISFDNIKDMPFSQLEEIDAVACFLKRYGFTVLIPVGDALQDYDSQLFEREKIAQVGNKSRAEMQRMALAKNVSADEIFFIDEVKRELNISFVSDFLNKIRNQKSLKELARSGGLDFYLSQNLPADIIQRVQQNPGTWDYLLRRGVSLSDLINLNDQSIEDIYAVDSVCNTEIPISEWIQLGPDLRAEVFDNLAAFKALITEGIPFSELINLESNARKDIFTLWKSFEYLAYMGMSFSEFISLAPELKEAVLTYFQDFALSLQTRVPDQQFIVKFSTSAPANSFTSEEAYFLALTSLECSSLLTGVFLFAVPKLRVLELKPYADLHNNISLQSLPLLNRLEIDFSEYQEIQYPIITGDEHQNLIELSIKGKITSLEFIETVLDNSPNVRLLELHKTDISAAYLEEWSKRYPNLIIHVVSRHDNDYREFYLSGSSASTEQRSSIHNNAELPTPSPVSPAQQQEDKSEAHVVYASTTSSELISDFNTKHNPEKTFTMQAACKHLSQNKENRFPSTRDGIYTLDLNAPNLFSPMKPRVLSNYPVPVYQAKLPTDDFHDFYEFKEKINLQPGECYQIKSLSAHDILLQLTLNGRPLQAHEIDIQKNELGFYTIKTNVPLKGDLSYILDIPDEKKEVWGKIPQPLQDMITNIQSFPSREVEALDVPDHASPAQKLNAMYDQKKASCRHRVAILLHKINQLKTASPELYSPIAVRGVDRGGVHVNIEISIDGGKTFEILELGGYETKKQYVSTILPALQFSSKQVQDAPKPVFTDIVDQMNRSRGKNTFLCLSNSSDIDTCLSHIRQKSKDRPIFYVDSPDQLRTSLKRLKLNAERTHCAIVNPPTGLLHDFLMRHQHSDPPPIIVINWENFKPSDMVQFNSVIDTERRRVDNTPISAGATIVGLHSRNEKMMDLLGDASFVSRHATGGIHDLAENALPAIAQQFKAEAAVSGILKINLHQSPRWQDILIGRAYVDGDQLRWQDGRLFELINNPAISHVEFINPPVNDRAFNHFIADLKVGLPLTCLNQVIPINRSIDVKISAKAEFADDVRIQVTRSDSLAQDAFVINALTFEQCLHGKKITDNGLLITEKGLIEAHANGVLKLCLSGNLSDSQWSLLLDYAKRFNVALQIFTMPDTKIPSQIQVQSHISPVMPKKSPSANVVLKSMPPPPRVPKPPASKQSPNQFIISDDVEFGVVKVQGNLQSQPMIVDFSEISLDDLFCKTEHEITDSGFAFNKQFSAVWQALSRGETVILKGRCSEDMLHYLATLFSPTPYFYLEGQKHFFPGKLIVVADESVKAPSWLPVKNQKIAVANDPLIQSNMAVKKASVPPRPIIPQYNDLSLSACESFEKNRLEAVKHVLSYSPFVALEGAPGVGKSYFIRTLQSDRTIQFYREDEIEKWATEDVPPGVQKILFRDEINLRGIDCSQDRDLLNNPPSIFVNGKHYRLTENCKIMYAQNPQDYGGERREPKLFQDLPDCKVVFEQMSRAFILHRILKPIFDTTFDEADSLGRAAKIIHEHFSVMRSIRDLQTEAIFECALHRNPIPPAPVNKRMVCVGEYDFILTASRAAPYRNVLTLLESRSFKRALPDTAPDGARFNGANGLVLQGPPGVGKSEFIEAILRDEQYTEVTKNTTDEEINSGKVYFRLRASVSNEEKLCILHSAFQKGAILVIDEIDSCPLLEDYLNAYLTGEDIHGKRAEKPGFTVFSTANGAAMKGRRVLPAPLKSRMLALEFNEYPREDLIAILNAKFIPPGDAHCQLKLDIISFLADGFLTEQHTNRETPPTFRDLYVAAKDYFENQFEKYVRLGLSKEQHELMLAYRNHPSLDQFIRRLESGEFKAQTVDMEKLLKSASHALGLFGGQRAGESEQGDKKLDNSKRGGFLDKTLRYRS